MKTPGLAVLLWISAVLMGCAGAQKPHLVREAAPDAFEPAIWIIGSETREHWKGLPVQVNAPSTRTRAYPGQHLTLAVAAGGTNREQLLRSGRFSFALTSAGATREWKDLVPADLRALKAHGADQVLRLLKAGRGDIAQLDGKLSVVSLVLFDVDWEVPAGAADGAISVQGTYTPREGAPKALHEASASLWSFDRAAKDGAFVDSGALSTWIMTYYQHPEPGRLLHALGQIDDKVAYTPNILAFYAEALRASPEAARDLLGRLRSASAHTRLYGLRALREAGYDVAPLKAGLSKDDLTVLASVDALVPPLPDPYALEVNVAEPLQTTTRMDMLWSTYIAAGSVRPVRAIAGILAWHADGYLLSELQPAGARPEVTPALLRALAYRAAGWSLYSFVRTDELASDYVSALMVDPSTPAAVREELKTLDSNPQFRRN